MYQPKSREYYISKCLFYNGNNDFDSYGWHRSIAIREQWWVDAHYNPEQLNDLREQLKQYKAFGLGHFNSQDNIPITLKTMYWLLWLKECEGMGTAEDFKAGYRRILAEYAISKCRYYRGEKKRPAKIEKLPNGGFYWWKEQQWVYDFVYRKPLDSHGEYDAYVNPAVPKEYGIPKALLIDIFIGAGKMSYSLADLGASFRDMIEKEYMSYCAPKEWQHFPTIPK